MILLKLLLQLLNVTNVDSNRSLADPVPRVMG